MIDAKTVEWQCSGCDHLCKLLLDSTLKPNDIIKCDKGVTKWRSPP